MPQGLVNRAALPAPSALPEYEDAPPIVLTTQFVPKGVSLRIVVLPESTTPDIGRFVF